MPRPTGRKVRIHLAKGGGVGPVPTWLPREIVVQGNWLKLSIRHDPREKAHFYREGWVAPLCGRVWRRTTASGHAPTAATPACLTCGQALARKGLANDHNWKYNSALVSPHGPNVEKG